MSKQIDTQNPAVGIQLSVGLSALGADAVQMRQALTQTDQTLSLRSDFIVEKKVWVGACSVDLIETVPDALKAVETRNLRFALTALQRIEAELRTYTAQFDPKRLAIIIGTSTSGIADNEPELRRYFQGDQTVQVLQKKQEMDSLAKALQQYLAWEGLAYTISTACSSSAKALAAGQRLINAGLSDAVLVGGVDTLCKLTLNGFNSLESLSQGICQPCGQQRDGINIGEAAALFLLSKQTAPTMLISAGESMDAWHISAPHPEGQGAAKAMQAALDLAQLKAQDIGYLNLHGTATLQNDAMEIKAVQQVFQDYAVPLSSTKHKTGHCLGAAGAIEAMICTQVLQDQTWLPLHQNTRFDAELDMHNFVEDAQLTQKISYVMSNSFAFGGSNISLIFGTTLP
ncbi:MULTISPECIES: beta-ketoacyl-[acyl-carrier-protein] synthase family protein [unclassified Acinetobacter]|uniref:beta-ketoacyl-[acyl-carrier-protein] synthase family protein n=1 Tax=unclassified Acinetobacter TaxID=196816 RepID=UPI002575854B|nr:MULTISPECIES: beta-ketoacyl-[acyl-carrier-protein] synthase family protein [unclassified Acinetobacter]MDM1757774.1 beta-ketoacyl-[acyl-carrier-protein] synthase family protein [Acinetobacter sp. 256-1]MDM1761870.1 beta-ketoacyl-[acyl-carrier-protein] synthase family protein [Acinetobacter sp. 251-1]